MLIPTILTANTFFWTPSASANGRRSNEQKRQDEVKAFFEYIGLETEVNGDSVTGKNAEIEATFTYSESCKNVYKNLTIYKNGKKPNISAIKKLL